MLTIFCKNRHLKNTFISLFIFADESSQIIIKHEWHKCSTGIFLFFRMGGYGGAAEVDGSQNRDEDRNFENF